MLGILRNLLAVPLIFLIGCAPGAATPGGLEAPARSQGPGGPKRLVLAVISEPVGFSPAVET